jgi:hypothetical protein
MNWSAGWADTSNLSNCRGQAGNLPASLFIAAKLRQNKEWLGGLKQLQNN